VTGTARSRVAKVSQRGLSGAHFDGDAGFHAWAEVRVPVLRRRAYLLCGNWHTADGVSLNTPNIRGHGTSVGPRGLIDAAETGGATTGGSRRDSTGVPIICIGRYSAPAPNIDYARLNFVGAETGNKSMTLHAWRLRSVVALTSAAMMVLGSASVPAYAQAADETELLSYTVSLVLDGVPHIIEEDGDPVPAEPGDEVGTFDFPPSGVHTFARLDPFWSFGDRYGNGSEQMTYGTNYESWGYKLSPAMQRIIVGTVNQKADLYHGSTRTPYASHPFAVSDYHHHGSMPFIESRGTYSTTFRATFRHNVAGGGNGVVSAQWNWQRR
jgi:hypothetical protein